MLITAIFLIAVGLSQIIRTLIYITKWQDSRNWLETTGRITRSDVRGFSLISQGRTRFRLRFAPEIEYEYTVNLVSYNSKQLYWMQNFVRKSFGGADDIASEYPVGKIIQVYYNPDSPEEAVSNTKRSVNLWWTLGESLLELGIGVFALYQALNL